MIPPLKNSLFFRAVFSLQQNWAEGTDSSHVLSTHRHTASLLSSPCPPSSLSVTTCEPARTHQHRPTPTVYIRVHWRAAPSVGLDKRLMSHRLVSPP